MVEKGGLLLEYRTVLGKYRPGMHRADMHVHMEGDTATTPERTLFAAASKGIKTLIITDHDRMRTLNRSREVNEAHNLGLQLVPGVESTAVVERRGGKRGKPRHVLVFGAKESPPCYMPVARLNEWAHDQGAVTSAAHPGLGRFSMMHHEMQEAQDHTEEAAHFDYAEVHNGGVPLLVQFCCPSSVGYQSFGAFRNYAPVSDTNETTRDFLTVMKDKLHLKGVTVGSDDHDGSHVGEVSLAYNPELGLFGSIHASDFAVLQQRRLARVSYLKNVPETVREEKLEFDRRRGKNGIALYVPKSEGGETPIQETVLDEAV